MNRRPLTLLTATLLLIVSGSAPALMFAADVPAAAASPKPTPLNAHDRLVDEIAKIDHYLLSPNIPADKRARLSKARDVLDAKRRALEMPPPSVSPRR